MQAAFGAAPSAAGPAILDAAQPKLVEIYPTLQAPPAAAPATSAANAGTSDGPTVTGPEFSIIQDSRDPLSAGVPDDVETPFRNDLLDNGQTAAIAAQNNAAAPPGRALTPQALLRGLVNSIQGGGGGGSSGGGAGGGSGNGGANADAETSFIEQAIADLVVEVLNPEVTAEGLVTFSIAGFGQFALILSAETGGLFFVDLERGTAIKVLQETPDSLELLARRDRGGGAGNVHGRSTGLQRFLDFIDRYIAPVVTSPITLAVVFLFGIIWVVFRLSAARA